MPDPDVQSRTERSFSLTEDTKAIRRLFNEAGGSLSSAQLDAAIFMGYDGIWGELRELERNGEAWPDGDNRWSVADA